MKMKGAGTMNITDVRVRKVAKEGKMKAVVSITIDEEFVVHDIKVIEGEKGLFIAMPSRKATDGEYRDIAHPINSRTRDRIQTLILEKYQEMLDAEPEEELEEEFFGKTDGTGHLAAGSLELANGGTLFLDDCLLYTSPSPRDPKTSRMPSSA